MRKQISMIDTEKLLSNINIKDVIELYTGRPIRNNKTLCPFHNDHNASLTLKTEKGIWRCWTCGKGGNIINFTRELYGLGFIDACNKLAQDFSVDIEEPQKRDIWDEIEAEIRKDRQTELKQVRTDIDREIELLTTAHRNLFRYGADPKLCDQYTSEIESLEEYKQYWR